MYPRVFILLLLLAASVYPLTVTETLCANATTLLTNTTYDNGTQFLIYETCQHDCVNNNCLDSSPYIQYAWLFIVAISVIIVLLLIFMHKAENHSMKHMFFFIIIILLASLCFVVGGLGDSIGEKTASAMLNIGYVFGIIFIFFFIMTVYGWLREKLSGGNDEEDEEEND